MTTHENEIMVYYNPQSSRGKKVLALAHTVSHNVKEVEYHKTIEQSIEHLLKEK